MSETALQPVVEQAPAEEVYLPPRFWWLKRLSLAAAALAVLLTAAYLVADYVSKRHLEKLLASYRAAGEPVYPEDFVSERKLPDESNAAWYYTKAAEAFTWPASFNPKFNIDDFRSRRFIEQHFEEAAALVAANEEMLGLMRQARACSEADWSRNQPGFPSIRQTVKLLFVASLYHSQRGNHAEMVQTLLDGLHLADQVDSMNTLIGHLVALSATALMVTGIEAEAASLTVAELAEQRMNAPRPADPGEVRRLIERLLSEDGMWSGWNMSLLSERTELLGSFEQALIRHLSIFRWFEFRVATSPALVESVWVILARPIWRMDAARAVESITDVSLSNGAAPYPRVTAALPQAFADADEGITGWLYPFTVWFTPSLQWPLQLHYRTVALRRMAAVALAIRMYELDHGSRPAKLEELVSDYLPGVPVDPFAADGRAIGYQPDADPPVLYSVSLDGVDDGGAFGLQWGYFHNEQQDLLFFLNGDRPGRE